MLLLGFLLIVLMMKNKVCCQDPVKNAEIIDYGVFPVDSHHHHLSLERCGQVQLHLVGQDDRCQALLKDVQQEVLPGDALFRHLVVHDVHQEAVRWEEDGHDQASVCVEGQEDAEDASPQTFLLAGVLQQSCACSTSLCPSRIFPTGSEGTFGKLARSFSQQLWTGAAYRD